MILELFLVSNTNPITIIGLEFAIRRAAPGYWNIENQ